MLAIFGPLVSWIFRVVVVKFLLVSAVLVVVVFLVPVIVGYLGSFLSVGVLDSAFAALPPAVWWWLDIAELGYGLPLMISAAVARFLIRRVPFLG